MPIYFFLYIYFHDFSVKNYLILYAKQSKLGVLRKLRPRKHRSQTPKNSDPWAHWKHRPPEKLRPPGCIKNTDPPKISDPLGVSKTQTPPKSQTPWVYRKHRPPKKHRPPECIENTDPPGVSKTQTPRAYRKHRPPKNSEHWMSRKLRPPGFLENADPRKTQTPLESQTPGCLEKFRL